MEKPEPQKEHRWLRRLAGEWTFEVVSIEPGGETRTFRDTERARMLGDVCLLARAKAKASCRTAAAPPPR
jgi:hypothetical protein